MSTQKVPAFHLEYNTIYQYSTGIICDLIDPEIENFRRLVNLIGDGHVIFIAVEIGSGVSRNVKYLTMSWRSHQRKQIVPRGHCQNVSEM